MLAPFLLIGVGGSGGKTLRTARAALQRRMREIGWEGPLPDAWQFLHIDVPTVADGLDPELPGALPTKDYAGLVGSGVTYKTVDKLLSSHLPKEVNLRATGGWRPVAEQVSVPIDRGAGQFRAIGRVITVTHLDKVKDAIEQSVGQLRGPEVKGQLQKVAQLLGADETQEMPEPIVVIVSSIAGGSGAGAVVDVCWTVRAAGVDPDQTFSVLYAPDVFDGVPGHLRKGVRPNALATLSELCAAWWNDEGVDSSTHALYSQRGVAIPNSGDSIPRMILVGRRNQSVDYVQQNAVYMAMGRSLAAWMSSENVQDEFSAYFVTNAAAASLTTSHEFPSLRSYQTPPFRGIGFARVSLGRDLFGEYATQWLAREGVETVLRGHHRTRRGPSDDRTDQELIQEKGNLDFKGFMVEAGIDERGYDNNQVLDALKPSDREDIYWDLVSSIKQDIRPAFERPEGLDAQQVRARITEAAQRSASEYLEKERVAQHRMGREWVQSIQKRIAQAAARSVARSGANVTVYMLDKAIREEFPFVVEELRHEAQQEERWGGELDSSVQQKLSVVSGGNLRLEDTPVEEAIKMAANCLLSSAKAIQVRLAWELMTDLAENYLAPLKTAIEHARQRLAADEEPNGAIPSYISLWPSGDQIPKGLQPSSNEFLLETTDTFYDTLQRLIYASIGEKGAGDPVGGAVGSILIGGDIFEDGDDVQTSITSKSTWVPERYELRTGSEPPRRAQLRAAMNGEEILERAQDWAFERERRIGRYMAESLGHYLSEADAEPEVARQRLLTFEGKLGAAIRAAEPLIDVDGEMLQQVHGLTKPSVTYLLSELPFRDSAEGRPPREIVSRIQSQTEGEMKYSFEDSDAQFVDVFGIMDITLQPVVIESLMGPIAEDWAAAKMSPATREQFWRWRRARPLTEFIPLAPAVRRAMVRGYFTALLLEWLELPAGKQGFSIWDADSDSYVPFPAPLLQPVVRDPSEYGPALLKSIPLAWLDSMVQRNLQPMRPYQILLELGGPGGDALGAAGGALEEYLINADLLSYLQEGDDEADTTPEQRRAHILERVETWVEGFAELFEEESRTADPHRVPRAYEMRDDITSALDDLVEAIRHADLSGGSTKKRKFI